MSKVRLAGQMQPANWFSMARGSSLKTYGRHSVFNQTSRLCNFSVHLAIVAIPRSQRDRTRTWARSPQSPPHHRSSPEVSPDVSTVMWGTPWSSRETSRRAEMFWLTVVMLPNSLEFPAVDIFPTCVKKKNQIQHFSLNNVAQKKENYINEKEIKK